MNTEKNTQNTKKAKIDAAKEKFFKTHNVLSYVPKAKGPEDIFSRVVEFYKVSLNLDDGDIYNTKHFNSEGEPLYALTKDCLMDLADRADIDILKTTFQPPDVCQKCKYANENKTERNDCINCKNVAVAYSVIIAETDPITGRKKIIEGHYEIDQEEIDAQLPENKENFFRHRKVICITKATLRALRNKLHIKASYTLDELKKPFVIMRRVPNLDNEDVKKIIFQNMRTSKNYLYDENETNFHGEELNFTKEIDEDDF